MSDDSQGRRALEQEKKALLRRLAEINAELGSAPNQPPISPVQSPANIFAEREVSAQRQHDAYVPKAGRKKRYVEDYIALIDIATYAGGYAHPLQWSKGEPLEGYERVPVCTVASSLADTGCVKGNSRRAIVERLRSQFRKREEEYYSIASYLSYIVIVARIYEYLEKKDRLDFDKDLATAIMEMPEILDILLPSIRHRRDELRARLSILDRERQELLHAKIAAISRLADALAREGPAPENMGGLIEEYWRLRAERWPDDPFNWENRRRSRYNLLIRKETSSS